MRCYTYVVYTRYIRSRVYLTTKFKIFVSFFVFVILRFGCSSSRASSLIFLHRSFPLLFSLVCSSFTLPFSLSATRASFSILICCFLKSKFELVLKIMDHSTSDCQLNPGEVDYEFESNEVPEV